MPTATHQEDANVTPALSGQAIARISKATARIVGAAMVRFFAIFTRVRVRWAGTAPSTVQRIYFANHQSHVDEMLMIGALAKKGCAAVRPICDKSYWTKTWLRQWLTTHAFDCIYIDREQSSNGLDPLNPVYQAMAGGHSVLIFPEGTRGDGTRVQRLKTGIFKLAKANPRVELVPVKIANSHKVLPKGAYLPRPYRCSVTFGRPLLIKDGESVQRFLERALKALSST